MRFFNTTGPCRADMHYMLPPQERLPELDLLIAQQQYFVLHAARQTGKTTAMRAFAQQLRAQGIVAVHVTLETAQGQEEIGPAEASWLEQLRRSADIQLPAPQKPPACPLSAEGERLGALLKTWSEALQPALLVLLLDEVDVVRGPALINLLRQLRAGFPERPDHFPASIALIGMRDLRDYLTHAKDGVPVNPGSPFNIKSASLTLRNFTAEEVTALYTQHTEATGQIFTPEASERAFWWTQGQPFLVNALARICVQDLVPDRGEPVTAAHIDAAKEKLIQSRTTHLDSLTERLKEARVARIVQPALLGDTPFAIPYDHDDFQYVLDLGLLRRGPDGAEAANPLYREILVRQLGYNLQEAIRRPWWPRQNPDGTLNFPALMEAFLAWWRENEGAIYAHGNKQYPEALAHLAFLAFLQRVVNGGGHILREFAAGREAVDVVVEYAGRRSVIEIKRVFKTGKSPEKVRHQGIEQLAGYLDTLGEKEGWLLIFDQRGDKDWEQRLFQEDVDLGGKTIRIRGA